MRVSLSGRSVVSRRVQRSGVLIALALSATVVTSTAADAAPAASAAVTSHAAIPAHAAVPPELRAMPERPAVLHFADIGGIKSWHVLGAGGLLIEGQRHQFYLAEFFGICPRLRSAEAVGFVTDATGSLTQFDSIIVDGERCHFRTLQRVPRELAENVP